MKSRLAILASGEGTTAEAFIRAGQRGDIDCRVELVICSRKNAGIFERIKQLNEEYGLSIETKLINGMTHPAASGETVRPGRQTEAEEAAILNALKAGKFDLIAQMGYMKHTGARIVHEFGWRTEYTSIYQAMMVNTHPGLLPDTEGMYGDQIQHYVLENELPYGGQSLHVVADGYDDGPVIAEHKVPVEVNDTPASLFERVQQVEKQFLPHDIETFIEGRRAYLKEHKE